MSEADCQRWDARWQERQGNVSAPSPFVTGLAGQLPTGGRALDLAGGAGRHAVWLATQGLDVTIADISPVALESAMQAAQAAGVRLRTRAIDLDQAPLPEGPWDLILSYHYLNRVLFPQFARVLAPGGWLIFVQPTRTNLARFPRPSGAHLLEDGELPRLVSGLEIRRYEEGWLDEGRHEARLIAVRPMA